MLVSPFFFDIDNCNSFCNSREIFRLLLGCSHTLPKTFGYHQRKNFGRGVPERMVVFNHSTQRQTLDYLCIQPDEIKDIYLNEL